MAVTSPAVGDPATASWADSVAAAIATLNNPSISFFAEMAAAASVPTGSAIALTAVDDNSGSWNATTHQWVVPMAGAYIVAGQLRVVSAVSVIAQIFLNSVALSSGLSGTAVSGGGSITTIVKRFTVGQTIDLRTTATYTSTNAGNDTTLSIIRVGN